MIQARNHRVCHHWNPQESHFRISAQSHHQVLLLLCMHIQVYNQALQQGQGSSSYPRVTVSLDPSRATQPILIPHEGQEDNGTEVQPPMTTTRSLLKMRQSQKKRNDTSIVLSCAKVKNNMKGDFRPYFDPLDCDNKMLRTTTGCPGPPQDHSYMNPQPIYLSREQTKNQSKGKKTLGQG